MKHFIAIHRFHNDEKRKEYCMSPERKDPPEAKRTVKEWADFACNTNPKAKCRSQWNGDEISFCHWEAESAEDIHEVLEEVGMAGNMITMPQEMHRFVTTYDITDKKMVIPPRSDES